MISMTSEDDSFLEESQPASHTAYQGMCYFNRLHSFMFSLNCKVATIHGVGLKTYVWSRANANLVFRPAGTGL